MGLILIVIGFITAITAGAWFALQVAQGNMQSGAAVAAAGLAFVPIAGVVLAGIYLWIRQRRVIEPESMVEKQRQLVEFLNERRVINVTEMAAVLSVDEPVVRELIEQLIRLDIFAGHVDWDSGVLYAARAGNPADLADGGRADH